MNDKSDAAAIAKALIAVWGAIGITSWADASYFFAALLSLTMLVHYYWKHFWRPMFERMGWLKPNKRSRREINSTDWGQP